MARQDQLPDAHDMPLDGCGLELSQRVSDLCGAINYSSAIIVLLASGRQKSSRTAFNATVLRYECPGTFLNMTAALPESSMSDTSTPVASQIALTERAVDLIRLHYAQSASGKG